MRPHLSPRGDLLLAPPHPSRICRFLGSPACFDEPEDGELGDRAPTRTKLDAVLEDAAMLAENADLQLTKGQIEAMLRAVVDGHLTKLDRVAAAAKNSWTFDVEQARADDRRAMWAYKLLDAQGFTAVVQSEDRVKMASEGLSEADIEAVQDHLARLRVNELVQTKPQI